MTNEFGLPEVAVFALVTVRIAGIVVTSPLLWGGMPPNVRGALVVLLSAVTYPTQTVAAEYSASEIALAVPTEFLIGATIGFVVRVILAGIEVAGDAISPAIGIQAGSVFDPAFQSADSAVTRLLRYGALLVAILGGAHRTVIGATIASFRAIPISTAVRPWMSAGAVAKTVAGAFSSGIALALPLVAILFLTHIALAFVSRAAPSIQIFSVGFALTLAVGTATIVFALPDMFSILSETYADLGTTIESVVRMFVVR